jgi:hypothetical protein
MIRLIVIAAIAGVALGCSKPPAPPALLLGKPLLPGYVRPDDPNLRADVAKAIQTAKMHLEKLDGRPLDAMYKATKTASGFEVHVEYVTGYDDSGQPVFIAGGHCNVRISAQGRVVEVQPGA